MEIQVNIAFDQLLRIVKALPEGQLKLLKAEIESEVKTDTNPVGSLSGTFLMKGINSKSEDKTSKKKEAAKSTGNFDEIFGLWKGKNNSLDKIRNQQWGKRIK